MIFTEEWLLSYQRNINEIINKFGTTDNSALIRNVILDFIFGKKIESLNGKEIVFNTKSEYVKRVYTQENGMINYNRDPSIIVKENRFARELVLRNSFIIQSYSSTFTVKQIIDKCNFDFLCLTNAINYLISRGYIEKLERRELLRLTFDGVKASEDLYISHFSNKIFLIAACFDDIYKLIDKAYRPAVEELGYELIFQEKSEPKGSITDEIYENIEGCKLIICDFTHQRPNCFIEYGYAKAKGKQIILAVEENEGKDENERMKVPFDTQTEKYSFWHIEWLENEKELEKYKNEIKERVERKLSILATKSEI
jgi:predicted transcriptional regulator